MSGLLQYVVVFFTLTDRTSTRPSNIRGCQSVTWSQRGTKVNGSPHHGDNPLLRPTWIQIATKSYATLQAMAPTTSKTVHQTSFTPYREQPRSTRIVVAYPRSAFSATNRTNTFHPVLINNSKFLKATHRTKIRKIGIPRSMVVEALSWWSRRASQHPAVQSPVHPWKSPTNLARSPLHVALVGRKMTMVRDQLFSQKSPGSRFRFSRTGVQPSPGSSTIELPSAFAESGPYPPDWELPGSSRQCSLPLACRHPPEGHQIGARKRRTPENTILSQPYCRRVSTDRPNREGSQLAASLEGEPGPTPAGKTLPQSYPETRFRRERAREWHYLIGSMADLLCHRSLFSWKDNTLNVWINNNNSISRATSIESECCRLPTTSVLRKKTETLRSNQFWSTSPSFSRPHIVQK